jgi:hypothetical protein
MEHKTKTGASGGKNIQVSQKEILRSLLADLEVKISVKGHNSSGDVPQEPQPTQAPAAIADAS